MKISLTSIIIAACALMPAAAFGKIYCNGNPKAGLYCIQSQDGLGQHVTDTDSTVRRIENGELELTNDPDGSFGTYLVENPGSGIVQVPESQSYDYRNWSAAGLLGSGMDIAGNKVLFYGSVGSYSAALDEYDALGSAGDGCEGEECYSNQ